MKHVKLLGTGAYLPERVMTNEDLSKLVDTNDEWITERTGIKTRHIADESETTASLATQAARRAIESSGCRVDDIDMIIVATATPDYFFPSVACEVQAALQMTRHIPAFDLSAACTGFMYAWTTAQQYIQTGMARHVLVIGAEILSRVIDWQDRATCILFGDGAGAVVLGASDTPGILASRMASDSSLAHILTLPNPAIQREPCTVTMNGREVFKFAVNKICELTQQLLEQAQLTIEDLDWFVPHQANLRMFKSVSDKLNFPFERISQEVIHHGNTSSASIPMALDAALKQQKIGSGHKVILEGFGGGMTWAGSIIQL